MCRSHRRPFVFSRITTSLLLFILVVSGRGQQLAPLFSKQTIALEFDKDGNILNPVGFGLLEGKDYKVTIKIAQPGGAGGQLKKLQKYFLQKLKNTQEKLTDPSNKYAALYENLWSEEEQDEVVEEIKDLIDILEDPQPATALTNSGSDFRYFLGKAFLQNHLIDPQQQIKTNLSDASTSKSNAEVAFTISGLELKGDQLKWGIEVYLSDPVNQFIRSYFLESIKQQSGITSIAPHYFYSTYMLDELGTMKHMMDSVAKVVGSLREPIVCDEPTYLLYLKLLDQYNHHPYIRLVTGDWLKRWLWLNEGDIAINPLTFTDEKRLPLKEGFDPDKAMRYDRYRQAIILQMTDSREINDAVINYTVFDSLLNQQGKGKEFASNKAYNDALTKANKAKSETAQQTFSLFSQVKFNIVSKKKEGVSFTLAFDRAKGLKGGMENANVHLVSTDDEIAAYAYNLGPKEIFTLKTTIKAKPDQSAAITGINTALDAATALQPNLASVVGIVQRAIALAPLPNQNTIPPFTIQGLSSFYQVPPPRAPAVRRPRPFRVDKIGSDYYAILTDSTRQHDSLNLEPLIKSYVDDEFMCCVTVLDQIRIDLEKARARRDTITEGLEQFISSSAEKLDVSTVENNLATRSARLQLMLSLASDVAFRTLPPEDFKEGKDVSTGTRTAFQNLTDTDIAIIDKEQLLVLSADRKDTLETAKLRIKRAPPHRLAGSLGIIYIWNRFKNSSPSISNGSAISDPDENQVRLLAGLHVYLRPILNTDDRPIWKTFNNGDFLRRTSVFAGVSFPDPLQNLHFGGALDIWPGVKITGGVHLHRYTKYTLLNNQITDQRNTYLYNGGFLGLTLDPVTFVKLIGLFK